MVSRRAEHNLGIWRYNIVLAAIAYKSLGFLQRLSECNIVNFSAKNMHILSIIPLTKLPLPSPQILNYFSREEVSIGGVVKIDVGARRILGIVIASATLAQRKLEIKKSTFYLKPIAEITNKNEVIPKTHLKLISWTSRYFYSPLGLVAKSLLPQVFNKPTKKFLDELARDYGLASRSPNTKSGQSRGELDGEILLYWDSDQKTKLKFYRKQISSVLNRGGQILFLVPELYKIDYIRGEIPELREAIVIQSALSTLKEWRAWNDAQSGKIKCIIGTRSALSIPLPNLELIIIDDEESPFYKSFDQQPYINFKDVALQMAKISSAKVILGTSLPSVESYWKTKNRLWAIGYGLEREEKNKDQTITRIVDMREEIKIGNYSIFSKELQKGLGEIAEKGGQALLFINRKGLATGLLCRDCGHVIKCPNCDVSFVCYGTNQSGSYRLICHHCGLKQTSPPVCPECKSYKIKFIGTGTQRVENELQRMRETHETRLPISLSRTSPLTHQRLDLDIAPTWEDQSKILQDFRDKKFNVLIGTQLMLKKELLPKVDLAAIMTVDPLLSLPDFRMGEQVVRIIHKLNTISSKLILQTYMPENYIIRNFALTDSLLWPQGGVGKLHIDWLMEELKNRKELSYPPFSQLIKLTFTHNNPKKAEQEAKILKNKLLTQIGHSSFVNCQADILGPAPAFIPRVKNRYIWQIMIKSKIEDMSHRNKLLRVVASDWKIDVEPVDMI